MALHIMVYKKTDNLLYCMKNSRFRGRVEKTAKLKCRENAFRAQPRN